jgi:hypothetical protein
MSQIRQSKEPKEVVGFHTGPKTAQESPKSDFYT